MKHITISLHSSEAIRIKPQVLNMMNSTTPIIFRDRFGRMFVLVHGLKNRGFAGGYTEESLYEWVKAHSNIREDETLYIISCFSSTNALSSSNNMSYYIKTEYPVFICGINILDEYDSSFSFDIITDVKEIPIFAKGLAMALSISEEKATSIINGED